MRWRGSSPHSACGVPDGASTRDAAPAAARTLRRIAVLASGGGSNLDAILDHLAALGARRGGDVVLVASDRAAAGALGKASAHGVATAHIGDPRDGDALDRLLGDHGAEMIALAGYLRLVPSGVTRRFRGRIVNVHPALLPAFGGPGMYGQRAHRAVLDAGATISGVTAHFVDDDYDRGPIIAQWPVPVGAGDTPETLGARVLRVEHILYPRIVNAVAAGRISLGDDNRVRGALPPVEDAAFTLARTDAQGIARAIDRMLGSNDA